jgi:parallel beta helix pectate lyase-like protein
VISFAVAVSLGALLMPPYTPPGWPDQTPSAGARVLVVSPGGDDSNLGTRAEPFRTIPRAAEAAVPGTTVVVTPGTYPGSFRTAASGTASARITYVAESRWGARLVGDDAAETVWHNDGDHVEIRGFEISGAGIDGLVSSGSYVRIAENRVSGFPSGNCITTARSEYTLHDIDVIANVTHGCGGSALDHGIYVSHPGGTVANNISFNNAGYGIHCWHNCNRLVISNNLVFANKTGGIVVGQGDGPNHGAVAADGFVVSNNIAFDNGGDGIVESGATGPDNRYLHNIISGNAEDDLDLATGRESGTISLDPLFVDYRPDGTGVYRLQAASPGIDAGTPDGAPASDIEGTPRPRGRAVDIGPYER